MKAAAYLRVSTEEQVQQGTSLESQKERLLAFCKSQGWEDVSIYMDDGFTGTNLNRPAMRRLMRHIEEKKVDAVVVYKLDRLGRKQKDVLYLLEDVFDKNGVIFKSASEPFDTGSPLGKAMIGVLAVFAQLERDMIVERTTTGRRQRVSQGKWYGGPVPFGYAWNQEVQQLEIVPEEAAIVKEIFKRYLQGQSRLAIAEWAESRTTARKFDSSVIRDMLSRPIYMGKLINHESIVEGRHEAIIEADTWYAVQRESERRSNGLSPVGEYLLTGLLECGICGAGIVHVKRTSHKNGKTYVYHLYACKNQHVRIKDKGNNCSLGYFRREKIEDFVIGEIKHTALDPKPYQDEVQSMIDDSPDENLIKSVKEKLEKVNQALENLYDAIQSGDIKASAVRERIANLEEEQDTLQNQLEDILDEVPEYQNPNQMFEVIREVADGWNYLDEEDQKILIRSVIQKVTLFPQSDPVITWNYVK